MKIKYPKASKIPIIWDTPCKTKSDPQWISHLENRWVNVRKPSLSLAIRLLANHQPSQVNPQTLPQHPFDTHLCALSSLYRKSRNLFIQNGGGYLPTLNTSPRTLSSLSLLDPIIEYSPVEREYIWAATNAIERKNTNQLTYTRGLISNLFHEQNHRILWNLLPNAPLKKASVRRYLNFAESLVVTLDMALSDQLGPTLSSIFHLCGLIYDRGADTNPLELIHSTSEGKNLRRLYRNYLHACVYSTYLYLELYEPAEIIKATQSQFNTSIEWGTLAAHRSIRLDSEFVQKTNPFWQMKNWKKAAEQLQSKSEAALELPDEPNNPYQLYLWAEKWFELIGL